MSYLSTAFGLVYDLERKLLSWRPEITSFNISIQIHISHLQHVSVFVCDCLPLHTLSDDSKVSISNHFPNFIFLCDDRRLNLITIHCRERERIKVLVKITIVKHCHPSVCVCARVLPSGLRSSSSLRSRVGGGGEGDASWTEVCKRQTASLGHRR